MRPGCEEYKSIGQAHDNWQRLGGLVCNFVHNLNKPTTVSSSHTVTFSPAVMTWSSTVASMRILPTSLLLLLLSPVGLARQKTSNYTYLPQVSSTIRNTAGLTQKQEPECSFRHVTASQVAKLITAYDILTFTLQPSARHVLTACSLHSLVANMASVASMMVNVNAHRGGPGSIA